MMKAQEQFEKRLKFLVNLLSFPLELSRHILTMFAQCGNLLDMCHAMMYE